MSWTRSSRSRRTKGSEIQDGPTWRLTWSWRRTPPCQFGPEEEHQEQEENDEPREIERDLGMKLAKAELQDN